jgi:hypothetical protein
MFLLESEGSAEPEYPPGEKLYPVLLWPLSEDNVVSSWVKGGSLIFSRIERRGRDSRVLWKRETSGYNGAVVDEVCWGGDINADGWFAAFKSWRLLKSREPVASYIDDRGDTDIGEYWLPVFGEFNVERGSDAGDTDVDEKKGAPAGKEAAPMAELASEPRRPPVEVSGCIERKVLFVS